MSEGTYLERLQAEITALCLDYLGYDGGHHKQAGLWKILEKINPVVYQHYKEAEVFEEGIP